MSGECFHLGVFAKYWQPGRVKTRLAATLGDVIAAKVYRLLLTYLLARLGGRGRSREVVYSPDTHRHEFVGLVASMDSPWQLRAQGGGDLGARLQRYFHSHLTTKAPTVVLGSDSPTLPLELLEKAGGLLAENEVVLGPSEDGGYYLIAIGGDSLPPVFERIDWSTSKVWSQTIERLEEHGLPYAVLPKWYDVDDQQQLDRLLSELQSAAVGSAASRLYRDITELLPTKR